MSVFDSLCSGRIVVVHGRGDVWGRFVIHALYFAFIRLAKENGGEVPSNIRFVSTGSRKITDARAYFEQQAREFDWFSEDLGPYWDEFCSRWSFVQGRATADAGADAIGQALKDLLEDFPGAEICVYHAIALLSGNITTIDDAPNRLNLNIEAISRINRYPRIVRQAIRELYLEKPAGLFEEHYMTLGQLVYGRDFCLSDPRFKEVPQVLDLDAEAYCIDHYLPKAGNFLLQSMVYGCKMPCLKNALGATRDEELRGSLSEVIKPQHVEEVTLRFLERIGTGSRAQYIGPLPDTLPHHHAVHHSTRNRLFCGEGTFAQRFEASLPSNVVFNPLDNNELQQRKLKDVLGVQGRYFISEFEGNSTPDGYWLRFTPVIGEWASVPTNWQLVKSSYGKTSEVIYTMKPRPGVEREQHIFYIETDVPGVGRSFGHTHEWTEVLANGARNTHRESWTVPCPPEIGNGYRHVMWEVLTGKPDYMLSLRSQLQGISFGMAIATQLDFRYQGTKRAIRYRVGSDPLHLINDGRPGHADRFALLDLNPEAVASGSEDGYGTKDRTFNDDEVIHSAEGAENQVSV